MYSEAETWKFSNSVNFINNSVKRSGAWHFIDLGCWYGVISRRVKPMLGRHVAFEAVIDTYNEMRARTPPRIEAHCRTICRAEDYQPVIHLTPDNTLNTSRLGVAPTATSVPARVGAMCTPEQFVAEWGGLLENGGIKTNIEGQDIAVLLALLAANVRPKFILSEIYVGDQQRWLHEVWPSWQHHYGLQGLDLARLLEHKSFHIGVCDRFCCWWYSGKRMIYSPNKHCPVFAYDCAE